MNSISDDRLTAEIDKSLCRSRVYALLAAGLGYPDKETYPGYVGGSFADEMSLALAACCPDIAHDFSEALAPKLTDARLSRQHQAQAVPLDRY